MLVYITTFQLFCSDCCPSNRRSSYIKQNIILVNLGCFVFLVNIIVNMSNVIQHQKSHPYILTPNKIMSYRSINSITSLRSRTTTYFCRQCAQLTLLPLPGELRESERRALRLFLSSIFILVIHQNKKTTIFPTPSGKHRSPCQVRHALPPNP